MAPPVRPWYNVRLTPLRLRYGVLTLNPWSGARWSILLFRSPAHVMLQYHVVPPRTPFRFVSGFVLASMTFRLHAHGAPPRRLFSRAPLRSLPGCLHLFDGFPAVWRHEGACLLGLRHWWVHHRMGPGMAHHEARAPPPDPQQSLI
jgi:hypothetical protein